MRSAARVGLLLLALASCKRATKPTEPDGATSVATIAPSDEHAPAPPLASREGASAPLVLLLGGDVDLGRALGRRLVEEPRYRPFGAIDRWLRGADLRFANLESPLSDQRGELQSPQNPLVFNGPPHAAQTLAQAGFDIVSTANNHAFDYGESGVLGTLESLRLASVESVGTGPTRLAAESPRIVERGDRRVAFVAATDVWNQGASVPARAYVADADAGRLSNAIRKLHGEPGIDVIVVSVHAGEEYQDVPLARVRSLFRSLVDAGADVVVGHHPHVPQGVEWHAGKPIFYSLGNLAMRMHQAHPETGTSFLARVVLGPAEASVSICPYRIVGHEPRPLADDATHEVSLRAFEGRFRARNRGLGEASLGAWQADGCAPLSPPR